MPAKRMTRPVLIACVICHDCATRAAICAHLSEMGFAIAEADDEIQGLEVLRRNNVTLAIVDMISAPIAALRNEFPTLHLLAISSSHQRYLELAHDLGANGALMWPYLRDELLARVRSLLQGQKA